MRRGPPRCRKGDLEVEAAIKEGPGGRVGAPRRCPTAARSRSATEPFVIGRLPDCDLPVEDPLASRRHAEIRPEPDAYASSTSARSTGRWSTGSR